MSDNTSVKSVERKYVSEYVYPEWFTEKKYSFYKKMLKRLKQLRYVHSQSAEYYEKMNFKIFGPSITITALSGIASFLSTASFIETDAKNGFGVTVGVLTSISTLLQSVASACQFSAKVEAHRTAADQYNKLIVRLKFEMEMPNEKDFVDKLETEILDIQNKCNYFPPSFIMEKWQQEKLKIEEKDRKKDLDEMKHRAELAKIKASTNVSLDNTFVPQEPSYVKQSTVQPTETMQTMQQPTVQQTTYVAQPMQQPIQQPIQQPMQQPMEQPMQQPTQQPMEQPMQQAAYPEQPTVQQTTYVAQQSTVQQTTQPMQPIVQQTTYVSPEHMEQHTVQQTTYVSAEQSMEQATPQPTFVEQDPVIEQNQTPIETEEVVDNLEDSTQDAVEPVENKEITADLPEPEPNTTDEANNVTINIEDNNDNQEE